MLTLCFFCAGFHDKLQKPGANKDVMITALYSDWENSQVHTVNANDADASVMFELHLWVTKHSGT